MIIGITGQTGSGKSTVCRYLSENGFFVCDCDAVACAVRNDAFIKARIAEAFGNDVVGENGELDRKELARRAFSSKESVGVLNSIMHPEILKRAFETMRNALENGYEYAVLDAPQLFESGADKLCDIIVSVTADKDKRLDRILMRDGISEKEAQARLDIQYDDAFYIEKSDFVIRNNDSDDAEKGAAALIEFAKSKSSDKV